MLGIAPLGSTALGDVGGRSSSGGGGGGGPGGGGGGGPGGGGDGGGTGGGSGAGLPLAVFRDRRGVLSTAIDSAVAGNPSPRLAIKAPVRVATVDAAIVLSGLQTIDGIALAAGDRVLVRHQLDPVLNGIYLAGIGPWRRAADADGNDDLAPGAIVEVAQGDLNAGTIYTLSTSPNMLVRVGTTPLVFNNISINPPVVFDPILDSGGPGLVTGLKLQLEVPSRIRLQRWTLFADQAGSIDIDIWRAPFVMLPLTSADSITGAAPPRLVGQRYAQSNALTGWDIDLAPGDILGFSILSVTNIHQVKLALYGRRPL